MIKYVDGKLYVPGTIKIEGGFPSSGYVLTSDADGNGTWVDPTNASILDSLDDVTITGATTGQSLVYNGSAWVNDTVAAGSSTLDALTDTTITDIATGEILKWTGAAWENNTLAEAGIADATHTHATTDITSGTFADARIAQSNVTQHQAALIITESQISDLGSYLPLTGGSLSGDLTISKDDPTITLTDASPSAGIITLSNIGNQFVVKRNSIDALTMDVTSAVFSGIVTATKFDLSSVGYISVDSTNVLYLQVGLGSFTGEFYASTALRTDGYLQVLGNSTLGNANTDTATIRGEVTLTDSSASYPLNFGADVELYRSAANTLYTPDNFTSNLRIKGNEIEAGDYTSSGEGVLLGYNVTDGCYVYGGANNVMTIKSLTTYIGYGGNNTANYNHEFTGTVNFKSSVLMSTTLTVQSSATFSSTSFFSEYLYHLGDTDTYFRFQTNRIDMYTGNNQMMYASANTLYLNPANGNTYFGSSSSDFDFVSYFGNWAFGNTSATPTLSYKLTLTGDMAIINNTSADYCLTLDQNDLDFAFTRFDGYTSATDGTVGGTWNVSTFQGSNSVVVGPFGDNSGGGWAFYRMLKININGVNCYLCAYSFKRVGR